MNHELPGLSQDGSLRQALVRRVMALTAVACASALALGAVSVGTANAETTTIYGSTLGATTTSETFEQQGSYSTSADAAPSTIYIAIPEGLTPTTVRGRLVFQNSGLDDTVGKLEIIADGALLTTIDKSLHMHQTNVTFPVSENDVANGYLTFSLRYLSDGVSHPGEVCTNPELGSVTMDRIHITLTGHEVPPSTLATFFSAAVRTVSVTVPDDASSDVKEAGLAAVASIAHAYPSVDLSLTTPSDAARAVKPTAVGGRLVKIVPGTGNARTEILVSNGIRTLVLTGNPSELPKAAAALGSTYLAAADATKTTELTQTGVPGSGLTRTFYSLGQSAPKVAGLGVSQFIVGLNLSDFGRSVSSLQVHLVGQHAALPNSISGVLSYYWNGSLVGSENLVNSSTAVDRTMTISSTRLAQSNTLTVKLVAIPSGNQNSNGDSTTANSATPFNCGGALSVLPIEVDFDGKASTVTATPGEPFVPGFQRFPQALGNVLTIAEGSAFTSGAQMADELTDAGSLAASLQRANTSELDVRLIPLQTFLDSSASGIVVGASSDEVSKMQAPLEMGPFRTIDSNDVNFGAGISSPYAVLQGFSQGGRDVLCLSAWGAHQPDRDVGALLSVHLVDAITKNGWYSLGANLFISQSLDKDPVGLSSVSIVPQEQTVKRFSSKAKLVLVVVAAVILALIGQQIARRRLRARARKVIGRQMREYKPVPRHERSEVGDVPAESPAPSTHRDDDAQG